MTPPPNNIAILSVDNVDFGNVPENTSVTLSVLVTNSGDADGFINFGGSTDVAFSSPAGATTVPANGSAYVQITFNPTDLLSHSATLTWTGTFSNSPVSSSATGTGVNTPTLGMSPTSLSFGPQKTGTSSAPQNVTITNTSVGSNVTVNSVTLAVGTQFSLSGLPAFPKTLTPGQSFTFQVTFSPLAPGVLQDTINVASSVSMQPSATLNGQAFLLTPYASITNNQRACLVCCRGTGGPAILQFSPSVLTCESQASLAKAYDFANPGMEKTLKRLFFRYENLGVAKLTGALSTTRSAPTSDISSTPQIGTAGADGLLYDSYFDFEISGDVVTLIITVPIPAAGGGPISLTQLIFDVFDRGEYIEAT